ncbi:MAG TPA: HEPN family nuclease [Cyclobacteriaceae bacterium]|nr:HEPN family nuclease [Cyclobacteriaceae bacterium]
MDFKKHLIQAYLGIDFTAQFIAMKKSLPNTSLEDFYQAWQRKNGISPIQDKNEIFTPGLFLGYLYVAVVLFQQSNEDKIPNTPINKLDKTLWGNIYINSKINSGKNKQWKQFNWNSINETTIKYIIRRIRNSLSHFNFIIDDDWYFTFYDDPDKNNKYEKSEISIKFSFDDLAFKFLPTLNSFLMNE